MPMAGSGAERGKRRKAEAYYNSGLARVKKGAYDGAIADFTRAIELFEAAGDDENAAKAYNNRGLAWAGKRDYDRAISDWEEALRRNPGLPRIRLVLADAYNNRGLTRVKKGDYNGAIEDYTRAIELNPEYAEAYYNRGVAGVKTGDHDGAIADYDKAIKLNSEYWEAYYSRGTARYRKEGQEAAAEADREEGIKGLFEKYGGKLVGNLKREFDFLRRDKDKAKDIVEYTFTKIRGKWYDYFSWNLLWRIASNKALKELRRTRQPSQSISFLDPAVLDQMGKESEEDPFHSACTEEKKQVLRVALNRLTEEERKVVMLRCEDYDWKEIGDFMGKTEKEVENIYQRALETLKGALRQIFGGRTIRGIRSILGI